MIADLRTLPVPLDHRAEIDEWFSSMEAQILLIDQIAVAAFNRDAARVEELQQDARDLRRGSAESELASRLWACP